MSQQKKYKSSKSPSMGNKSAQKSRAAINTDSDSDYDVLDLADDSEEDERDVLRAEEQEMLRPSDDEDAEDEDEDEDDEGDIEDIQSSAPQTNKNPDYDVQEIWEGFALDPDNAIDTPCLGDALQALAPYVGDTAEEFAAGHRRVHWDSDGDDSDDSQVYDEMFPDIFVQQDQLDAGFRREMEMETNDICEDVSDDASFRGWDFGEGAQHDANVSNEVASQDGTSSEDYSSSSGYESEGETTDEDVDFANMVDMVVAVPTKDILRKTSTDSSSLSDLDEAEVIKPTPRVRTPYGRRGPILANWLTDPRRPYAFVDQKKKKLVVVKNKDHRAMSTPLRPLPNANQPYNYPPFDSPLVNHTGDVMFGGLFPLDTFNGDVVGPPEAFYALDGTQSLDDDSSFEDEQADHNNTYDDYEDFIDYGEDDDESTAQDEENDEDDGDKSDEPTEEHAAATPSRPTRSRSGSRASNLLLEEQVHPLLEHFERNPVGAFRSNQNRHALLSRNRVTKESLSFAGPYGAPIRGIKHDRMAAANVPITPARRPKSQKAIITPSPAATTPVNKRRMSASDINGSHKRSRIMN